MRVAHPEMAATPGSAVLGCNRTPQTGGLVPWAAGSATRGTAGRRGGASARRNDPPQVAMPSLRNMATPKLTTPAVFKRQRATRAAGLFKE